jgi:HAD superfamily hydrolase (TIGR01509 family)
MTYAAALFDLDGTLVDSEKLLYRAWVELAAAAGADFTRFDYSRIIGRPDLECCRIVSDHFGLGREPEQWYAEYRRILFDLMDRNLALRPGAAELVAALAGHGMPLAVVTSAVREHAEKALGRFGLLERFHTLVTADTPGLAARKPDPAPYRLAAKLLGVSPVHCLAFEDSPSGVRAARAAGCYVFGIPHAHSPETLLKEAHVIIDSLADVNLRSLFPIDPA